MLFLFVIVSFIDILGIGLIGPFIALLDHDGVIVDDYPFLSQIIGGATNQEVVVLVGCLLIVIFVSKGFISFAVQRKILSLGYEIRTNLINRLIKAYQCMSYENVVKRDISSLIVNTNTHVGLFVDSVIVPILRMLIELAVVMGIVILMALTNPIAMIGIAIILSLLLFIYFKFIKKRLYVYGRIMSEKEAEIINGINHVAGAFREIRLLSVEKYFRNDIRDNVVTFGEAGVITRSLHLVSRYLVEATMVTFIVLIVVFMLSQSKSSSEIFSTLGVFAVAAIRLVPSVSQIGLGVANIRTGSFALHELYKELSEVEEKASTVHKSLDETGISEGFNALELRNVDYTYTDDDSNIFSNISLKISKGDFVGIIGDSGAGKSTLMDIMLGQLTSSKGLLLVNDYEINSQPENKSKLLWWQSKCAYIPQDVFLINASIKNNIALGIEDSDICMDKLRRAIDGADISELVDKIGMDSLVGEKGSWLSGGQKQRIALARALYSDREVIFMDEATSALDEDTEENIMSFIGTLKGKITVVLITHRKATLKNCNRVYQLKDGKIYENNM